MADEEFKDAMERNKEIRAKQKQDLASLLRSSVNDKAMREKSEKETKIITQTSKDDARDKRRKIWFAISMVILFAAAVGVAIYLALK